VPGRGEVIAERLSEWGVDDLPLERALFGTAEPDAIATAIDAWCRVYLDAAVDRYEFFDSSSGSVHGLRLVGGAEVVVKGHRPSVPRSHLNAIASVQNGLADVGFPAPRPLAAATRTGRGHLTAEEMLRSDAEADGHDPAVRRALARGLSSFIDAAAAYRPVFPTAAHPMSVAQGELYPPPHSPRFDFAASAAGAEWIDAFATEARARLWLNDDGRWVVAHGDWRLENVRVRGDELVAVYDWDSVHVAREPVALAGAATTFSVDFSQPGTRFPSPSEIAAFVAEYEQARGAAFTKGERALLSAAMVASLSYGARCEHADPGRPPDGDDSQRGLLRRLGEPLLDVGFDALTR
jgi:hypothetical protein